MTKINQLPIQSMIYGDRTFSDRWIPKSIPVLEDILKIELGTGKELELRSFRIKKNICYNLQYIEYLQKQLTELKFTESLEKMIIKNYIITGMSIIEALFAYLLRINGMWNTSEWKSIGKNKIDNSKKISVEQSVIKVSTEVYKKVDEYEEAMAFDTIIKKVKDNNLISFGDKNDIVFEKIDDFRKMRNKIHLHLDEDTDYHLITKTKFVSMKYLLYCVLKNETFCTDINQVDEVYDFLILTQRDKMNAGLLIR